ncbi:MAG: DinB family protein [Acidobacteriota bacterium]
MADINTALDASKDAIQQLIIAGERTGTAWTSPRAPGKWSPSQIVEHVARGLEEAANIAAGRPSKLPKLPAVVLLILRLLFFKRILRKAVFPKGWKAHKAMDPASGPATPAEGRVRLETAHQQFDEACRQAASHGERMRTIFGAVPVEDCVRFVELHTRHHGKQMADR